MPADTHTIFRKDPETGAVIKYTCRFLLLSGSLTVEAALILPLCLAALFAFYGFFGALTTWERINESLCGTARIMASYSVSQGEHTAAGPYSIFLSDSLEKGTDFSFVSGGMAGVRLTAETDDESGDIILHAYYRIVFPGFRIFRFSVPVADTVTTRQWIGSNGSSSGDSHTEDGGQSVYVAENGVVYHTDPDCTYLKPHIRQETREEAEADRNIYGEHYHRCEFCGRELPGSTFVYVTEDGTSWHTDHNCRGLKRTVSACTEEEAEEKGLRPCSKCGGKH